MRQSLEGGKDKLNFRLNERMIKWILAQNRPHTFYPHVPAGTGDECFFRINRIIHGPFKTEEFPTEFQLLLINHPLKKKKF